MQEVSYISAEMERYLLSQIQLLESTCQTNAHLHYSPFQRVEDNGLTLDVSVQSPTTNTDREYTGSHIENMIYNAFSACKDIIRVKADSSLAPYLKMEEVDSYKQEIEGYLKDFRKAIQLEQIPAECMKPLSDAISIIMQEPIKREWNDIVSARYRAYSGTAR